MGKSNRKKQKSFLHPTRSPGLQPLSGALMDLVDPLYFEEMSLKEYQLVIGFAVLAWNVALFSKEERKGQLQAFFKAASDIHLTFSEIVALGGDKEVTEEPRMDMNVIELIKALIHRKDRLHPQDRRQVVEWDVDIKNDSFHVTAAYAPPIVGGDGQGKV